MKIHSLPFLLMAIKNAPLRLTRILFPTGCSCGRAIDRAVSLSFFTETHVFGCGLEGGVEGGVEVEEVVDIFLELSCVVLD